MTKTTLMFGFLGIALACAAPVVASSAESAIRAQGLEALERLETGMRASLNPGSETAEPAGNGMEPAIYTPGGVGFSIEHDQDRSPRVPTLRSF